jgi:DNA polymerase I-like protein with 3'-5' exonuclease and polymerase domains
MNEKFYAKYHGLDKQHKVWMQTVASGRPIEGPLGRSWFLEMGRDRYGNLKLPINQLVNLPVQGTGADIMTFARISAYKRIKKASIPKNIKTIFGYDWKVPMACESKYGPNMKEMQKFK